MEVRDISREGRKSVGASCCQGDASPARCCEDAGGSGEKPRCGLKLEDEKSNLKH